VPFFLSGGGAFGIGRGDRLRPVEDVHAWVVLARPPFGVSTAQAYGWWDTDHEGPASAAVAYEGARSHIAAFGSTGARRGPSPILVSDLGRNDLQPPVERRHPRIGSLVRQLMRQGATVAAMSGSGSAVFGLFASRRQAAAAAGALASRTVKTTLTRTIGAGEFRAGSRPQRLSR
jgi:4-diphosphocytidyl-2-C-methyl-D-erythritol kinase